MAANTSRHFSKPTTSFCFLALIFSHTTSAQTSYSCIITGDPAMNVYSTTLKTVPNHKHVLTVSYRDQRVAVKPANPDLSAAINHLIQNIRDNLTIKGDLIVRVNGAFGITYDSICIKDASQCELILTGYDPNLLSKQTEPGTFVSNTMSTVKAEYGLRFQSKGPLTYSIEAPNNVANFNLDYTSTYVLTSTNGHGEIATLPTTITRTYACKMTKTTGIVLSGKSLEFGSVVPGTTTPVIRVITWSTDDSAPFNGTMTVQIAGSKNTTNEFKLGGGQITINETNNPKITADHPYNIVGKNGSLEFVLNPSNAKPGPATLALAITFNAN